MADLPRAAAAAPGISVGQSHVLVFGGDDGTSFKRRDEPETKPGGFRQDVLAYHTITDTWATVGTLPAGIASTTAVHWRDRIVIPGGETALGRSSAGVGAGRLRQSVSGFGAWDYACLGAYLLSLVGMGIYFSRREKTTEDFFAAGRRIPWWAAGVSIAGTQTSAISFMAIPAKVYATDWVYLWNPLAAGLIAPLVVFVYLPFFRRLNLTTAYEYLEKRFHVAVRLFASSAFVLFHLGRMAIVLFLPAIALSTVTGIDVYACIVVMGVLCTLYTVLGGIEAVIWTDFLQVIVLIGGAFISLVIIAANVEGGFSGIVSVGMADSKCHACIELAGRLGIPVQETDIDPYDVREADEAWITSTPISMIPVTRFNFQAVGDGKPGSIYRRLLAAWSEEVGVDIAGQAREYEALAKTWKP